MGDKPTAVILGWTVMTLFVGFRQRAHHEWPEWDVEVKPEHVAGAVPAPVAYAPEVSGGREDELVEGRGILAKSSPKLHALLLSETSSRKAAALWPIFRNRAAF
jgi:hypothetical protein